MLKPSTSLDWYLGYIHCWVRSDNDMPMWNDIKITENSIENTDGTIVSLGELIAFQDYHKRFNYLVTLGRSWVNLNVLGLYNQDLILFMEIPNREPDGVEYTSVNFSGDKLPP